MILLFRIRLILSFLILFNANNLSSQKLPIVGVPTFAYMEPIQGNLANHISEFIINLLKNSGKYTIVDMTSEEQRLIALDRSQANYKAANWLQSNAAKNAEVILGGEITSIKFIKSAAPAQPGYRAAVTLSLKLIQVETSEIVASNNFASRTSELRLTPETALESSMESISPDIISFFKKHIAPVFPIFKINEIKKETVTKITCEIPIVLGFQTGSKFKLVLYEQIGDKSIPQIIGEARIAKHIAEDFWLLDVTKGGNNLYSHKENLNRVLCSE